MVGSDNSPTPTSRVDRGSGVSGSIASTHAKTGCRFTPSPRLSPNGSSDHTMLNCGPIDGHGTVCPAGDFVSTLHLTLGRPVTPVMTHLIFSVLVRLAWVSLCTRQRLFIISLEPSSPWSGWLHPRWFPFPCLPPRHCVTHEPQLL